MITISAWKLGSLLTFSASTLSSLQTSSRTKVAALWLSNMAYTNTSLSGLELVDSQTGTIMDVLVCETSGKAYEVDSETHVESHTFLCSFFTWILLSLCRQVRCYLLQVEQVNLLWQSLDAWPFFKHPKHNLFSLTNIILVTSISNLNFEQPSIWLSVFLQKVHLSCCLSILVDSLNSSSFVLTEKVVLFSVTSLTFCPLCTFSNISASFTALQ